MKNELIRLKKSWSLSSGREKEEERRANCVWVTLTFLFNIPKSQVRPLTDGLTFPSFSPSPHTARQLTALLFLLIFLK